MRRFVAQLATTTSDIQVRVWAWGVREIGNPSYYKQGNDITDFIDLVADAGVNGKVYIHRLKFYGQFLVWWLMDAGFKCIIDDEDREDLTFKILSGSDGDIFKIEVYFEYTAEEGKKARMNRVVFIDSNKIIDATIEEINVDFGINQDLPYIPEKVNYDLWYEPTEEEYAAIKARVDVLTKALEGGIDMGLTGLTIGACALNNFKSQYYHSDFAKWLPVLDHKIDSQIRKAYRGGYCYLNPIYRNREVGKGITIDFNSMYPSQMVGHFIPVGIPEPFEGEYQYDKKMPCYIQTFQCRFWIKKGKLPCVQVRAAYNFIPTMWQESSDGELVVLTLTGPEMELFKKNYNVKDMKYLDGWKFKAAKGLFTRYIKTWANEKAKAKIEKNATRYELSKRLLNSLYGKLGTNTRITNSYPTFDRNKGVVKYALGEPKIIDPVYVAAAAYITALARVEIINTAQAIRDYSLKKYGEDKYIYTDTDCIKTLLTREDLEELAEMKVIRLHDTMLGAYKIEDEFEKAKFIKPKCYIQIYEDGSKKVCVAGLPKKVGNSKINWDNFAIGWSTKDMDEDEKKAIGCKTVYKLVKGGCILDVEDFEILP